MHCMRVAGAHALGQCKGDGATQTRRNERHARLEAQRPLPMAAYVGDPDERWHDDSAREDDEEDAKGDEGGDGASGGESGYARATIILARIRAEDDALADTAATFGLTGPADAAYAAADSNAWRRSAAVGAMSVDAAAAVAVADRAAIELVDVPLAKACEDLEPRVGEHGDLAQRASKVKRQSEHGMASDRHPKQQCCVLEIRGVTLSSPALTSNR